MTGNGVWAIASGVVVFLALGLHGARRLVIPFLLIATVLLGVALAFEMVVFGRSPGTVLRMPLEVMAGTATSVGASVGLVVAALTNVLIARFRASGHKD